MPKGGEVFLRRGSILEGVRLEDTFVVIETDLPMTASPHEMLADACERCDGNEFVNCTFGTFTAMAEVHAQYAIEKARRTSNSKGEN